MLILIQLWVATCSLGEVAPSALEADAGAPVSGGAETARAGAGAAGTTGAKAGVKGVGVDDSAGTGEGVGTGATAAPGRAGRETTGAGSGVSTFCSLFF
jgi:hypothetical protein